MLKTWSSPFVAHNMTWKTWKKEIIKLHKQQDETI